MARSFSNRYFALRHGRSLANAQGVIISDPRAGEAGFGLTDQGREQVRASVAGCTDLDRRTPIVCSPFLRARQSADIAWRLLDCAAPVVDARLRERAFGNFEGSSDRNYAAVWAEDARGALPTLPGVETVDAVRARMFEMVEEQERTHRGRCILLVGHGDPLQILWTLFAGVAAADHRRLGPLETGNLVELRMPEG